MNNYTTRYAVSVSDNGTFNIVTDSANRNTQALNNNSRAAARNHSAQEGLTEGAQNSSQAFNNQLKGLGGGATGLIQLYGGLAANAFAVTAAFRALSSAADYQNQIKAAQDYGIRTGQSLSMVAKGMSEVTGEAISMSDALRHASITASAGFDNSQIIELTKVAKNASIALGRNLTDSLERVFKGAVKAEPELLDELGIILRLKPAADAYAASLGKTAGELTTFEKQQAVVNEVLRQGQEKFGEISDTIETNPYTKLSAALTDLMHTVGGAVSTIIQPFVELLSTSPEALGATIALFAHTIAVKALPSMQDFSSNVFTKLLAPLAKVIDMAGGGLQLIGVSQIRLMDEYVESVFSLGEGLEMEAGAFQNAAESYNDLTEAGMDHESARRQTSIALADELDLMGQSYTMQDKLVTLHHEQVNKLNDLNIEYERLTSTQGTWFQNLAAGTRIVMNRFSHGLERIRVGIINVHTAAQLGGQFGFINSLRLFMSRDFTRVEANLSRLGIAIRNDDGALTTFGRTMRDITSGRGSFSALARGVGIFAGAMSGLFKMIPVVGQLFMAWEIGSMAIQKISEMFGMVDERAKEARESVEKFNEEMEEVLFIAQRHVEMSKKGTKTLQEENKLLDHKQKMLANVSGRLVEISKDVLKLSDKDLLGDNDDIEELRDNIASIGHILQITGADFEEVQRLIEQSFGAKTKAGMSDIIDKMHGLGKNQERVTANLIEFNDEMLNLSDGINKAAEAYNKKFLKTNKTIEFAQAIQTAVISVESFDAAINSGQFIQNLNDIALGISGVDAALAESISKQVVGLQNYASSLDAMQKELANTYKAISAEGIHATPERDRLNKLKMGQLSEIADIQTKIADEENRLLKNTKMALSELKNYSSELVRTELLLSEQTKQLEYIEAGLKDTTKSQEEKIKLIYEEYAIRVSMLATEMETAKLQFDLSLLTDKLQLLNLQNKAKNEDNSLSKSQVAAAEASIKVVEEMMAIKTTLFNRELNFEAKLRALLSEKDAALDKLNKKEHTRLNSLDAKLQKIENRAKALTTKYLEKGGGTRLANYIAENKTLAEQKALVTGITEAIADGVEKQGAKTDDLEYELVQTEEILDYAREHNMSIQEATKSRGAFAKLNSLSIKNLAKELKLTGDVLVDTKLIAIEKERQRQAQEDINNLTEEGNVQDLLVAERDKAEILEHQYDIQLLESDLLKAQTVQERAILMYKIMQLKTDEDISGEKANLIKALKDQIKWMDKADALTASDKAAKKASKDWEKTVDDIGGFFGDMFEAVWSDGREGFADFWRDAAADMVNTFMKAASKMVISWIFNLAAVGAGGAGGAGGAVGTVAGAADATSSLSGLGSTLTSLSGITSTVTSGIGAMGAAFGASVFAEGTAFAVANMASGMYMAGMTAAFDTGLSYAIGYLVPVIGWVIAAVAIIGSLAGWFDSSEAATKINMASGPAGSQRTKEDSRHPDQVAFGQSLIGDIRFGLQHVGVDEQMSDADAKNLVDEVLQPMIDMAVAIDNALVTRMDLTVEEINALTIATNNAVDNKLKNLDSGGMGPDEFLKERLEIILELIGGDVTELHTIFKTLEDTADYTFAQMIAYTGALLIYADAVGDQKNIYTNLINQTMKLGEAYEDQRLEGEPLLATIIRLGAQLGSVNNIFDDLGWSAYEVSIEGAKAADSFVKLLGGIEAFIEAVTFYSKNFLSINQQMMNSIDGLVDVWGDLSLTGAVDFGDFPRTREEFIELINSVDDETKALLLMLAPRFDAMYDAMEDTSGANAALIESYEGQIEVIQDQIDILKEEESAYKSLQSQIESFIESLEDDIKDLRKISKPLDELKTEVFSPYDIDDPESMQERIDLAEEYRDKVISTMEEQIAAIEEQIEAIENLKAIGQELKDLAAELRADPSRTTKTTAELYYDALAEFDRLSALAAGGDESAARALADLGPELLDLGKLMFGGTAGEDYGNLFDKVTGGLDDVGDILISLSTEDLLQDIADIESAAADELEELAIWMKDNMLVDVETKLEDIGLLITQLNEDIDDLNDKIDDLNDTNSLSLNVLGYINTSLGNWKPPKEVDLNDPNANIPPADESNLPVGEDALASETTLASLYNLTYAAFGKDGYFRKEGLNLGIDQLAAGGIADTASIFGEAGPEAAVPLPDGRSIPVTLTSPINSRNSDGDIVAHMQEMQIQNAYANQELVENLQELKEEIARLKQNVGDPIVNAIAAESKTHSTLKGVG